MKMLAAGCWLLGTTALQQRAMAKKKTGAGKGPSKQEAKQEAKDLKKKKQEEKASKAAKKKSGKASQVFRKSKQFAYFVCLSCG